MSNQESCIICLEGGRNVLANVRCRCLYWYHTECMKRVQRNTQCPMCRSEVGPLYNGIEEIVIIQAAAVTAAATAAAAVTAAATVTAATAAVTAAAAAAAVTAAAATTAVAAAPSPTINVTNTTPLLAVRQPIQRNKKLMFVVWIGLIIIFLIIIIKFLIH
jgi:hypothetical protein